MARERTGGKIKDIGKGRGGYRTLEGGGEGGQWQKDNWCKIDLGAEMMERGRDKHNYTLIPARFITSSSVS